MKHGSCGPWCPQGPARSWPDWRSRGSTHRLHPVRGYLCVLSARCHPLSLGTPPCPPHLQEQLVPWAEKRPAGTQRGLGVGAGWAVPGWQEGRTGKTAKEVGRCVPGLWWGTWMSWWGCWPSPLVPPPSSPPCSRQVATQTAAAPALRPAAVHAELQEHSHWNVGSRGCPAWACTCQTGREEGEG